MTPQHPRFDEFIERLYGPEGCNWQEGIPGDIESTTWECNNEQNRPLSRKILAAMGATEVEIVASLAEFEEFGGYCDCEVVMNSDRAEPPIPS